MVAAVILELLMLRVTSCTSWLMFCVIVVKDESVVDERLLMAVPCVARARSTHCVMTDSMVVMILVLEC